MKCIKIDKSLVKLGKRGKDTTTYIRNQRVDITTNSKDIKRIIREDYEWIYVNKPTTEMNWTSLKHYHTSLKKRNNMSSSISIKELEFIVKAFLYRLLQAKIDSVVNVINLWERNNANSVQTLAENGRGNTSWLIPWRQNFFDTQTRQKHYRKRKLQSNIAH